MQDLIVGCGDVGRRIAKRLEKHQVLAMVRTTESAQLCAPYVQQVFRADFDKPLSADLFNGFDINTLYYLVPPQKSGLIDKRSEYFLPVFQAKQNLVQRIVLISTTGVYGDCAGEWVTEESLLNPQTERAQRRLDMERQWLAWGKSEGVPVVVLRVPGIYAFDRLPEQRLRSGTPVVKAEECGYTNRIHAEDLAQVAIAAAQHGRPYEAYNATDGSPGKISEYLQEAAAVLGLPSLTEISMQQAQTVLSSGMLSYLSESRKISNQKMLKELYVQLQYPDFKQGITQ